VWFANGDEFRHLSNSQITTFHTCHPGHCDEYENYKQQCKRKATESETDDDAAAEISRPKRQKGAPEKYTNCEDDKKINLVTFLP